MKVDGLEKVSIRLANVLAFIVSHNVVNDQMPFAHITMLDIETSVAVDLGIAKSQYVAILGPNDLGSFN